MLLCLLLQGALTLAICDSAEIRLAIRGVGSIARGCMWLDGLAGSVCVQRNACCLTLCLSAESSGVAQHTFNICAWLDAGGCGCHPVGLAMIVLGGYVWVHH